MSGPRLKTNLDAIEDMVTPATPIGKQDAESLKAVAGVQNNVLNAQAASNLDMAKTLSAAALVGGQVGFDAVKRDPGLAKVQAAMIDKGLAVACKVNHESKLAQTQQVGQDNTQGAAPATPRRAR